MKQEIKLHPKASTRQDFIGEKNRLYSISDLHILMYLLTAVKPIVTGETYTTNRLKKAFTWQSTLPKGHLPEISTPAANGMTKMALKRSLIAKAMM